MAKSDKKKDDIQTLDAVDENTDEEKVNDNGEDGAIAAVDSADDTGDVKPLAADDYVENIQTSSGTYAVRDAEAQNSITQLNSAITNLDSAVSSIDSNIDSLNKDILSVSDDLESEFTTLDSNITACSPYGRILLRRWDSTTQYTPYATGVTSCSGGIAIKYANSDNSYGVILALALGDPNIYLAYKGAGTWYYWYKFTGTR